MLKVIFRCLASAPPIIGAFFAKELGVITSYAGVLAIVTVLGFPSLLYLRSKKEMELRDEFGPTYYDGWGASVFGAYSVLLFSVVAAFYIFTKLLLQ